MTKQDNGKGEREQGGRGLTRRAALKSAGVLAGGAAAGAAGGQLLGGFAPRALAQSSAGDRPIRIGFQVHRTGIGAAYGRWYERTTVAAVH